MKSYFILAAMLLAALSSAQAGELYRWVDQSGKLHYGDMPPAGAAQAEKVKISDSPVSEDVDLPYETRRAKENFPVTLYVADNCIDPCQKARDFLSKRGIPFTEKGLKSKEDIDAFKKENGGEVVPALAIGKIWLNGFLAEQWDSELDAANYPKVSPYQPPAAAKPSMSKPATDKLETEKPVPENPATNEPAAEASSAPEMPATEAP